MPRKSELPTITVGRRISTPLATRFRARYARFREKSKTKGRKHCSRGPTVYNSFDGHINTSASVASFSIRKISKHSINDAHEYTITHDEYIRAPLRCRCHVGTFLYFCVLASWRLPRLYRCLISSTVLYFCVYRYMVNTERERRPRFSSA